MIVQEFAHNIGSNSELIFIVSVDATPFIGKTHCNAESQDSGLSNDTEERLAQC